MAVIQYLSKGKPIGPFGLYAHTLCMLTPDGKVESLYKPNGDSLILNERGLSFDDGIFFNNCAEDDMCPDGSMIVASGIVPFLSAASADEYWFVRGDIGNDGLFYPSTSSDANAYIRCGKCGSNLNLDVLNPIYVSTKKYTFTPTTLLSEYSDIPVIVTGGDFAVSVVENNNNGTGGNTSGGGAGGSGGTGSGDTGNTETCVIVVNSLPAAGVNYEGKIYVVKGATSDRVYICMRKNGTYTWIPLDAAILR